VTDDGAVKILDFGLAKLTDPAAAGATDATISIVRTEEGTVLGTVAYMSPEQAEGRPVDARSDIFSFGAVLYEMVTGARPFDRGSRISTLSAILHEEPKPLGESVPKELERLLARCLRKDPDRRFQHMADLKVALLDLKEESESDRLTARALAPPARRRFPAVWLVAAALAALSGYLLWKWRPSSAPSLVLTRLTTDSSFTTDPAISPDGKLVAFASDRSGEGHLDLWVRQVAGGEPIRLTRHPSDDRQPSFSPDSSQVIFRSGRDGGGLYVVSALGGQERLVARYGYQGRFSPDGRWIAYFATELGGEAGEMFVVPATGGQPRRLAGDFRAARTPLWSPDSKHLLFYGGRGGQPDWWITALESGESVATGALPIVRKRGLSAQGPYPILEPGDWSGEYVFFSANLGDSTNLWRLRLPVRSRRASGEPERLTAGAGREGQPSLGAGPAGRHRLVFPSIQSNLDIWMVPLDALQGKVTGEPRRLTDDTADDDSPSLSADGGRMVFTSTRAGNPDVWLKDLAGGKERALTITPIPERWPRLSADGKMLAYNSAGQIQIYATAIDGGVPERLCEKCGRLEHWSPDGELLLYGTGAFHILPLRKRQPYPVVPPAPGQQVFAPRFSPDGRWVVFHAVSGPVSRTLYVARLREREPLDKKDWIAVTDGSSLDREPVWGPDGRLIYFLSERDGSRCVWAQRVDAQTKKGSGGPFPVYHSHLARRSLGNVPNTAQIGLSIAPGKLVVALNEFTGTIWMAELPQ
jgi:Tol biopolymer transport system component